MYYKDKNGDPRSLQRIAYQMGENIQKRRKQKNLTQNEFASLIGKDSSDVSRWENGHQIPKLEMVMKIADVLDCDLDYLLLKDKERLPEIENAKNVTGLSVDSIEYLHDLKTKENEDQLSMIDDLFSFKGFDELLSCLLRYKWTRDKVHGSSSRPPYHKQMLNEEFHSRVQPSYREVFIRKLIKAMKYDESVKESVLRIEKSGINLSSRFQVYEAADTMTDNAKDADAVKQFYDYMFRLFEENELTTRETQILRLMSQFINEYL